MRKFIFIYSEMIGDADAIPVAKLIKADILTDALYKFDMFLMRERFENALAEYKLIQITISV